MLRRLVNYINSLKCEHNFAITEHYAGSKEKPQYYIYLYFCPKCGYTKKVKVS